ncbi:MAG: pantoate--beta-alanine ligase [Desulfobulbus propionicus]|nr:MAG: pantoate--beta-alanine ligase [Desulfobulbus propionicus]
MKIITTVSDMQQFSDKLRQENKTIAFVPTMGYLHEGHLSLLKIGRENADALILSIFVNPAQFAPHEDLDSYPRNLDRDVKLAKQEGVDAVFVPGDHNTLYPEGYQSYVELSKLPNHLCGLSRPVFFRGVTTVVTQLFNITKPHIAVFGEKDFQQLAVIKQMVRDLKFDIEIIGGPIVREPDGLAMSSRNAYLREGMRPAALSLSRSLNKAKELVQKGVRDTKIIRQEAEKIITEYPENTIDYVSLCDPVTLDEVESVAGPTLMALAVHLNTIRLIDNTLLVPCQR